MRKLREFKVSDVEFSEHKFGDFKLTDINSKDFSAMADFGDGCLTRINVVPVLAQIKNYSAMRKIFYIRAV